ncbi:uncharacterized protein N7477_000039 [Penicillium maclennaniae]|uniref:uncharacterized protein n=1 Tax=Penicillium maclennaniae TaxID=1343394 RepID=UPI00254076FF|nr:uncharacterized protein N7477_000039 [Penicillium maclennaniae]KAJ5683694.1 hypothetical protein N7477_000039 [Penicillium maclennaniae]
MGRNEEKSMADVQHIDDSQPEWNLRDLLPDTGKPLWKEHYFLHLDLGMIAPYRSSITNGYEGSMLNCLQSMSLWHHFFGSPMGTRLGSLSNGVIFGQILAFPIAPWLCDHTASPVIVSELAFSTHRSVLVEYHNNLCLGVSVALASPMEVAGRRRVFLFSTVGMLTFYVIWTMFSAINQERNFNDSSLRIGVVVMIFFYQFSYHAGLNGPPWVYVTGVLPTHLRAKGTNIMQIAPICVLIFNGYANLVAMDAIS